MPNKTRSSNDYRKRDVKQREWVWYLSSGSPEWNEGESEIESDEEEWYDFTSNDHREKTNAVGDKKVKEATDKAQNDKLQNFRFLKLPKDVRMIVYDYALSLGFFDKFHKTHFYTGEKLKFEKGCPVLLLNRQIHEEASSLIPTQRLILSWGLIAGQKRLEDFLCIKRIRTLRHITISDAGLRNAGDLLTQESYFWGLCEVVKHLAKICRTDGHKLMSIKVSYQSEFVNKYLDEVPRKQITHDWIREVTRSLKELRGVSEVELEVNLPIVTRNEIVATMKAPVPGLLRLPLAVRQKIYRYSADLNDAVKAMQVHRPRPGLHGQMDGSFSLSTPTILQLNHQITEEAQEAIYSVPLVIANLSPKRYFYYISDYISADSLRRIKHMRVVSNSWKNIYWFEELWEVFNTDEGHNLESFELDFKDHQTRHNHINKLREYPDLGLLRALKFLGRIRGVGRVTVRGTLPKCFTIPLTHNMMLPKFRGRPWPLIVLDRRGGMVYVSIQKDPNPNGSPPFAIDEESDYDSDEEI